MLVFYFAIFLILEAAYIKISKKFRWTAGNACSGPAVSGGIIFYLSVLIMLSCFPDNALTLSATISISCLTIISFIDDLHPLSAFLRLGIQTICILTPVAIGMSQPALIPVISHWSMASAVSLFLLGFINIYNFMDGINGITAFYSLVTLISLAFAGIDVATLLPLIGAVSAFTLFNARRRALTFAGDTGAIILGVSIGCMLAISPLWPASLALVSVYITDSCLTIITRLVRGENIFRPHTEHMYQLLTYHLGIPALIVSSIYAALQLLINAGFLICSRLYAAGLPYAIITFAILGIVWIIFHSKLMTRKTINEIYTA